MRNTPRQTIPHKYHATCIHNTHSVTYIHFSLGTVCGCGSQFHAFCLEVGDMHVDNSTVHHHAPPVVPLSASECCQYSLPHHSELPKSVQKPTCSLSQNEATPTKCAARPTSLSLQSVALEEGRFPCSIPVRSRLEGGGGHVLNV